MDKSLIDKDGLTSTWVESVRASAAATPLPFQINKIGHVVVRVADIPRSVSFYSEILGFRVSDIYPASMMPGGMVFMRCNADHHGVALVGDAERPGQGAEFHHMAFEVSTLDEVIRARDHLRAHDVPITFEGRRRAGCQVAVEFEDPDGYALEIYWGLDQVMRDGDIRPPEQWRPAATMAQAVEDAPPGQNTTLGDVFLKP